VVAEASTRRYARARLDLLVIRHAVAENRERFAATGQPDALRPLTPRGVRKMERAVRGLARVAPRVSALASSPFVRAVETARIVAGALDLDGFEELRALVPGARPGSLLGWLRAWPRDHVAAVVGHEPHLGKLIAFLLDGDERAFAELRKGGACLIGFEGAPAPAAGELRWLLTPSQLRAIR
jgi:phosphohistidine phosphatase